MVVGIDLIEGHAIEALAVVEHLPRESDRLMFAAIAQYDLHRLRESDEALHQLVASVEGPDANVAYRIAQVHAWRGESEPAFEWLDRAYARHDLALRVVKIDPILRNLHGDPRFTAFLRKMNLPVD